MEEFQNRRTIYLVQTSRWLVGCYEIPVLVQTKWQQSGNEMCNFMFATRTQESVKSVVHSEVLLFLISIFCRHLQLFFFSLCIVDEYYPVLRVCNNKQWDQLFICDFRWLKILPIGTNIVSREWLNTAQIITIPPNTNLFLSLQIILCCQSRKASFAIVWLPNNFGWG